MCLLGLKMKEMKYRRKEKQRGGGRSWMATILDYRDQIDIQFQAERRPLIWNCQKHLSHLIIAGVAKNEACKPKPKPKLEKAIPTWPEQQKLDRTQPGSKSFDPDPLLVIRIVKNNYIQQVRRKSQLMSKEKRNILDFSSSIDCGKTF